MFLLILFFVIFWIFWDMKGKRVVLKKNQKRSQKLKTFFLKKIFKFLAKRINKVLKPKKFVLFIRVKEVTLFVISIYDKKVFLHKAICIRIASDWKGASFAV